MDPSRFDDLARLLAAAAGRRPVLRALLGAALGVSVADAADTAARKRKRGKNRDRNKDRDRDERQGRSQDRDQGQDRLQGEGRGRGGKRRKKGKKKRGGRGSTDGGQTPHPPPAGCCGADSCPDPEPGSTSAGCNLAGRSFVGQDHNGSIFRGIDGREANFTSTDNHGSVFAEACLQGASFRRAKLDGSTWGNACLFGADFTGADLGGDFTLFDDARFCDTVMPDGSVNDRDCGRETACCRAEPGGGDPECQSASDCGDEACRTKACQNGQCVYAIVVDGPTPNGACGANASGHCCEGDCCQGDATECNPLGICCAPNCAGRQCGPDGCGGSGTCGSCQSNQVCDDSSGQCLCTRQSCPDGCCSNGPGNPGACRPGDTVQNCGTDGEECAVCETGDGCLNQQCVACSPACPQGLRCNAAGQCVCDGQSCPNGCCYPNSGPPAICLTGRGDDFCGSGGETCVDCGAGARCAGQVCVCLAGLCDGCCENGSGNAGLCFANSPPVCGVDGNQCVSCPTNEGKTCNAQGQCVCTPQSCPNGCCDENGECRPGNTSQVCGTGGQACARCPAGQNCQDGVCACTPQSCPNGCCAADGTCQPGDAFGACGTGGNACAGCNDQQTCQDQQCVNCGNSTCICTGQSLCTDDGAPNLECSGPGDPNACFCYVSQTGQPICGGSVSILEPNGCRSDADCGTGGACVANTGFSGPCGANGKPFCVGPCCQPNCAGRECGPDGCGGSCGSCPSGLVCNASGRCINTCTPQNCASGCCSQTAGCQPGTANPACGDDGETCQVCGEGEACLDRRCEACVPKTCQDLGVACGPASDGCNGALQCGSCPLDDEPSCQDGVCLACDDACPAGCVTCLQAPDGTTICAGLAIVVGCQYPCSSDAECSADDFPTCVAAAVNRDSGETQTMADFCQTPSVAAVCVDAAACCQPDCAGKACGNDGCGGSCGSCGQCQECQGGTCQTTGEICGGICCDPTRQFCCTDAGAYCCENSYASCCQGFCCS